MSPHSKARDCSSTSLPGCPGPFTLSFFPLHFGRVTSSIPLSHCAHSPGGGSLSLHHTHLWRWTGCTCAGCPHPCVLSKCLLPLPAAAEPTPTLTFCLAGETGANHPVIRERPLLRWVERGWQPKVAIRGLATGGDMLSRIGKSREGHPGWWLWP